MCLTFTNFAFNCVSKFFVNNFPKFVNKILKIFAISCVKKIVVLDFHFSDWIQQVELSRRTENTAHNIGFAKAGVNFSCVESFVIISRKKPFRFLFFCNFEKTKMVFAWCSFNRNFRCKSPAFAKPFPVVRNITAATFKQNLWDFFNSELTFLLAEFWIWIYLWKNNRTEDCRLKNRTDFSKTTDLTPLLCT